ncbi:hypothetical protein NM208_g16878 [Fusarium decemcellulare]|uniref:Uncharacterized protein n=1 Tax=Fusarium decemcellulare TaxID=57161 RepID=A0ACC1R8Z8_9HYPO|nr:hypothetical protein NM208_g16878 [Fusarium decemcellulare]
MTGLEDYLQKAAEGKAGVPINYYLKTITRKMLCQMWVAKYYPGKYLEIKADDSAPNTQPGGKTMYDKLVHFFTKEDDLRLLLLNEPRGRPQRNVNLVLPACDPRADVGFLIMESEEYAHMSGSNTICTVTALLETGMIKEGTHNDSRAGYRCRPCHCYRGLRKREVDVAGLGKFKYDVA